MMLGTASGPENSFFLLDLSSILFLLMMLVESSERKSYYCSSLIL